MQTEPHTKSGSALVTTVIMLAVSTAIIGSIIHLAMSQSRIVRSNISRDRAFYLADAGLRCAVKQLVNGGGQIIPTSYSRTFFENKAALNSTDWGFASHTENLTGKTNRLVSVGRCNGVEQQVQILCVDLSTNIVINDFLQLAVYEGNENGTLSLISIDEISGPVHVQGNLSGNGAKLDRSEKDLGDGGAPGAVEGNARLSEGETWMESGNPRVYEGPATQDDFDAQQAWAAANQDILYTDGEYTPGEAFLDDGNGTWNSGEEFTDVRNTMRDTATEPIITASSDTAAKNKAQAEAAAIPGAVAIKIKNKQWYVDKPNGTWDSGETFVDKGNGTYDSGEEFVDDRDGKYNLGVSAKGTITGVAGEDSEGQLPADGNDQGIQKPDLTSMYYNMPKSDPVAPMGASPGWGHDVKVDSSAFGGGTAKKITSTSNPAHIFVMNPLTSGTQNSIPGRDYDPFVYPKTKDKDGNYIYGSKAGQRLTDDFFLEDPTHSTYGGSDSNKGITTGDSGNSTTVPKFIDVKANGNNKVYFVDGNLYIHSPNACAMRFAEPGTKVTIVVKGNITISDEFYYNGTYGNLTAKGDNTPSGSKSIAYRDLASSSIQDPLDSLCLIAMKDSTVNGILDDAGATGNIYLGDTQFGSGGAIHAYLYAENDFRDNNLNTSDQKKLSVFGCMAAGNKIDIQREGSKPTKLDVTFNPDTAGIPGAPPPSQTDIMVIPPPAADWQLLPGSWSSPSTVPLPPSAAFTTMATTATATIPKVTTRPIPE